MRKLDVIYKI